MLPCDATLSRAATLCAVLSVLPAAQAQTKSDDFGGLASYPVPTGDGGPAEFRYCIVYAKRAWRIGNMVAEGAATWAQAKDQARAGLGSKAADEEVRDFEALESGQLASPSALGSERFMRCAERLKLHPQPRHKTNSEFCFRSLGPLDLATRLRADGKSRDDVRAAVATRYPKLQEKYLDGTVNLAFKGPTIAANSSVIEDSFSACFAKAGERQGHN
jgi:hypothetical protein